MIKSINLTVKYADIRYAEFDKFTTSEQPWCKKSTVLIDGAIFEFRKR